MGKEQAEVFCNEIIPGQKYFRDTFKNTRFEQHYKIFRGGNRTGYYEKCCHTSRIVTILLHNGTYGFDVFF